MPWIDNDLSNTWSFVGLMLLLLFLAGYSWHRRNVPGTLPFLVGCLFTVLVITGMFMRTLTDDQEVLFFWFRFQSSWALPAATAITCFTLEYAWPGRWLTRRNLILLSILPVFFLLYFLFGRDYFLGQQFMQVWRTIPAPDQPINLVFSVYALSLTLINLFVFAWLFYRSTQHRWPAFLMASAAIMMMVNASAAGGVTYIQSIDFTVLALPYLIYAIALFGFNIFDPIPLARQMAIDQLHAGMIILNHQQRVVNLNPAAERILGLSGGQAIGRLIGDLLPMVPEQTQTNGSEIEIEVNLKKGAQTSSYLLAISRLRDWRGHDIGSLLLLYDLTRHKQVEAALDESREIQRLIFENAAEGIAIFEEDPTAGNRRLVGCNDRYALMAGRSKEELLAIGNPNQVQKSLPPVPYARQRRPGWAAQSEGFFSWLRPDGRENVVEYNAASLEMGGRLLTIGLDRDVTERTAAQAQIVEQQRALAILQERERLARDLHDSTGQVLSFTNLKLGAARQLLATGRLERVDEILAQLENAIGDAHADLREYILNLRAMPGSEKSFFTALYQYLDGYRANYDIHVDVNIGPGVDETLFNQPQAPLQLFRILQEAFSNARKHAQTDHVQVSFAHMGKVLRVEVQDNGRGFHPQQAATVGGDHFGMQIMRERAEQLGGTLEIQSTPGQGTWVTVEIPIRL
jgi:PAS domain S-box-containing protein